MVCIGLAQSFGALRALATEGIQRGHMGLHARNIATAAGAPPHAIGEVTAYMIAHNRINVYAAQVPLSWGAAEDRVADAHTDAALLPPRGPPGRHEQTYLRAHELHTTLKRQLMPGTTPAASTATAAMQPSMFFFEEVAGAPSPRAPPAPGSTDTSARPASTSNLTSGMVGTHLGRPGRWL